MLVQRFILFLMLMIAYSWDLKVYLTILGDLTSLTTAIPDVVQSVFHLQHYYKTVCQRVEEYFICCML